MTTLPICEASFAPHPFDAEESDPPDDVLKGRVVRYDARDAMALARAHPSPFDRCVRFNEEYHVYTVRAPGGRWGRGDRISVTGLLKYAFPEPSHEELVRMGGNVFQALLRRLTKYGASFSTPEVPEAVERLRHTSVRRRMREDAEHGDVFRWLVGEMHNTNEAEKDYDELLDAALHEGQVIKYGERKYRSAVNAETGARFVKDFWDTTNRDGTALHRAIELFLNGEPHELPPHLERDFARFREWYDHPATREEWGEPFRTEFNMVWGDVVGQADLIAFHPKTGTFSVLDWKRTKDPHVARDSPNARRYTQTAPGVFEVVGPNSVHWESARPFGNTKAHKQRLQLAAYTWLLWQWLRTMRPEGGLPPRVARAGLLVVEPRKPGVTVIRVTEAEFAELDRQLAAVLNARACDTYGA